MELQTYDKESLDNWYNKKTNTANRIINDLKLQHGYEGIMHVYSCAAKLIHLEHVVRHKDYPDLFTNNYVRVKDNIFGVWFSLVYEDLRILQTFNTTRKAIAYWLNNWDMYETIVARIIIKYNATEDLQKRNRLYEFANEFIDTSKLNSIKSEEDWALFFEKEVQAQSNNNDFLRRYNFNNGNLLGKENFTPINNATDTDANNNLEETSTAEESGVSDCLVPKVYDTITFTYKEENYEVLIPNELNNKEGQFIWQEIYKTNLFDIQNKKYYLRKNAKKELLAYISYKTSMALKLCNAEQDGNPKTNWKIFEDYFGCKELRVCKQKWNVPEKKKKFPKGHESIDKIFEKLKEKEMSAKKK